MVYDNFERFRRRRGLQRLISRQVENFVVPCEFNRISSTHPLTIVEFCFEST